MLCTFTAEQFRTLRACFVASDAESFINEDPAQTPIPPAVAAELVDLLNKAQEDGGRVALLLSDEQHSALVSCYGVGADGLADYAQRKEGAPDELPNDELLNEVEAVLTAA